MDMTELVSDRCGYTWPEDHKVDDEPNRQSCCWREVVDGFESCIWHADPNKVSKSAKELQQACAPSDIGEQSPPVTELFDGARLAGLEFKNWISFRSVSLRDSNFTDTTFDSVDFTNANLSQANFSNAFLPSADFTGTNLSGADFPNAYLPSASLANADLLGATFTDALLHEVDLTNAVLNNADLTNASLIGADLSNTVIVGADLTSSNLLGANLVDTSGKEVILVNADLRGADLSNSGLRGSDLTSADLSVADLTGVYLSVANLTDASLSRSDLTDSDLSGANFTGADLSRAGLTDSDLSEADLTDVDLEHAVCVRTNLFDANLTNCKPHGATLTDVQINHNTEIRSEAQRKQDAQLWEVGLLFPSRRCVYDPVITNTNEDITLDRLGKAADTYQSFEKLARENARPSLQSEMFVLRQDMQRKRHWHNRDYFEWGFAQLSRTVFKYGESLGRILMIAVAVIVAYAAIYLQFDLIRDAGNQFITDPVDALYFSTLTFTTLGLGDFQPEPTSQAARLLVTSQAASGAVLISIFVFVLGRRAAR